MYILGVLANPTKTEDKSCATLVAAQLITYSLGDSHVPHGRCTTLLVAATIGISTSYAGVARGNLQSIVLLPMPCQLAYTRKSRRLLQEHIQALA